MTPNSTGRFSAFPLIFSALVLLHVALIVSTRLFPFTDLPNHLAAATIHRYYGEAGTRFAEFFVLDLFPRPNVFHLLFCGLPLFPSVEFANRVYLSLYAAALPLSLLFLVRRFHGNRWYSLLAFPLLYNYSVSWGFVGFFLALPLLLFSFAAMAAFTERSGWGSGLVLAASLLSLFFVHALAAIFALLLFLSMLLVRSKGEPLRLLRGIPAALPLVLMLAVWWRSEPVGADVLSFLSGYYAGAFAQTFPKRVHLLLLDNYHLFEGGAGAAVAAAFSLTIIVPSLTALRRAAGRGERLAIRSSAPFVLFVCALCCFALLPNEIPRQSILYQRFSVLVLLSFALLGATASGPGPAERGSGAKGAAPDEARAGRRRAALPIVFTAAALLHLLLWGGCFASFDRQNRSFGPDHFPRENDAILAGFIVDHTYRGRPAYIHFPSYYTVWRKGIATTKLVDYRFSNVRRRRGGPRLPVYMEWPSSLDRYDGRYEEAGLLLVRGEPDGAAAREVEIRALLREADAWKLYGRAARDTDRRPRPRGRTSIVRRTTENI